jgi:hypothetical protein
MRPGLSALHTADTISFRELDQSTDDDDNNTSHLSSGVRSDAGSQQSGYFGEQGIRCRPIPHPPHPVLDATGTKVSDMYLFLPFADMKLRDTVTLRSKPHL